MASDIFVVWSVSVNFVSKLTWLIKDQAFCHKGGRRGGVERAPLVTALVLREYFLTTLQCRRQVFDLLMRPCRNFQLSDVLITLFRRSIHSVYRLSRFAPLSIPLKRRHSLRNVLKQASFDISALFVLLPGSLKVRQLRLPEILGKTRTRCRSNFSRLKA